jgi:hypothetical protein
MNSVPKPRWNFLRADWKAFADDLDHVIQFILAQSNSYERFAMAVVAAAKRHIPRRYRNQYIQGWNSRCDELYEEYNSSHRSETVANLLQELNDQRKKKWEKTVEVVNFTHSSRKVWKLLKKLGTDAIPASRQKSITANDIASWLLRVSKTQRD